MKGFKQFMLLLYLYDKQAYKEYLEEVQFEKMEYVGGFIPNK